MYSIHKGYINIYRSGEWNKESIHVKIQCITCLYTCLDTMYHVSVNSSLTISIETNHEDPHLLRKQETEQLSEHQPHLFSTHSFKSPNPDVKIKDLDRRSTHLQENKPNLKGFSRWITDRWWNWELGKEIWRDRERERGERGGIVTDDFFCFVFEEIWRGLGWRNELKERLGHTGIGIGERTERDSDLRLDRGLVHFHNDILHKGPLKCKNYKMLGNNM